MDNSSFEIIAKRKINRSPLMEAGSWDHIPTIFPFLLRHQSSGVVFNQEETARLYDLMQRDLSNHSNIPLDKTPLARRLCMPGQPVVCGSRNGMQLSVLRLSIDMRLIVDALSDLGRGEEAVIEDAITVLDKAALLAKYVF